MAFFSGSRLMLLTLVGHTHTPDVLCGCACQRVRVSVLCGCACQRVRVSVLCGCACRRRVRGDSRAVWWSSCPRCPRCPRCPFSCGARSGAAGCLRLCRRETHGSAFRRNTDHYCRWRTRSPSTKYKKVRVGDLRVLTGHTHHLIIYQFALLRSIERYAD